MMVLIASFMATNYTAIYHKNAERKYIKLNA